MANAQRSFKMVSDVVVMPLLDFLISTSGEYKDLTSLVKAFNAALDALEESSYTAETFGVYLDAVENKMEDLKKEMFMRDWSEYGYSETAS